MLSKLSVLLLVITSLIAFAVAAPQARIVNGDDAAEGQIPYQAQLFIAGTPTCGAAILSEKYVLTVSRCVCSTGSQNAWPPQLFSIRAGTTDLYNGGVSITVEEIILTPEYSEFNTRLALLRLEKSFVFSSKIQPIALAKENAPVGAEVDVSGFGRLKITDEYLYRTLQYYDEVMLAENACAEAIGKDDETVFCLGHPRKFGICTGDFGGPAAYNNELVGVAAYLLVEECGTAVPDVYVSVAHFGQWISENMV